MAATTPLDARPYAARSPWLGCRTGLWQKEINVRCFIQQNYTPYDGDDSLLKPATARTQRIWNKLQALFGEERRKGVLDVSQVAGSITSHPPGYIDRDDEIIVGLQTDAPLKRAIMPNGSSRLPDGFRRFAAKVAIDTSSLQFESDETMRRAWGDDGAIACCVSPMALGKQMQFFGARANLAKCMLYAINGGRDEVSGEQVAPAFPPVQGDVLVFDDVVKRFERMMDWLADWRLRQRHERHPLHARQVLLRAHRDVAARLRAAAHDGLRHGRPVGGGRQLLGDPPREGERRTRRHGAGDRLRTEGEFPAFGNNDNRVDQMAVWAVSTFMNKLRKYPTYRNALHTQSILTITSNVVYGKATGNAPDRRRKGEPFAPGANPMHGRDSHAAAASVAKIPYRDAADGISLIATLVPEGLRRVAQDRVTNMTGMLDAFFNTTGYHMNVNVLNRETLLDAMDHPDKYPNLTIRVSGYAVNFVRLTREQQMDVINRTFHGGAAHV